MKITTLNLSTVFTVTLIAIIFFTGCKKVIQGTDTPEPTSLIPEPAMFVSTYDNSAGATLYVLNALTGSLATKYTYPAQPNINWIHPVAGNGFLYILDNKTINAVNINTGTVEWTYAAENTTVPILHDNAFYGVYKTGSSYEVYSLDATKASNNYIWKYPLSKLPLEVKYFNSLLYVLLNTGNIIALDPKTGVSKLSITANIYSLSSLNNGVLLDGDDIIDATTGTVIATTAMPVTPPTYGAETRSYSELEYATKQLYFVRTNQFNSVPGMYTPYLTAMNNVSKTNKWQITYDGGYGSGFSTTNKFDRVWNNQLIMLKLSEERSKYGTVTSENYWTLDINTGARKVTFDNTGKGRTLISYIAGNNIFFNKRYQNTLSLPYGSEPVNYLFAIDLNTGKQIWNNDKLLNGYKGYSSSCVFIAGKGYSPYIQ